MGKLVIGASVDLGKLLRNYFDAHGTISSRINGTPKCFYLLNSKLHSILSIPNLLAQNNKTQNNKTISYYVPVNSLRQKSSLALKWGNKNLCGYHLMCLPPSVTGEVYCSPRRQLIFSFGRRVIYHSKGL